MHITNLHVLWLIFYNPNLRVVHAPKGIYDLQKKKSFVGCYFVIVLACRIFGNFATHGASLKYFFRRWKQLTTIGEMRESNHYVIGCGNI